jgi:ribosome maturation factor RimP
MGKLTDKIAELARPVVEQNGCELWDVEYVREAGANYLRVYVDKEGGVGIDDCERISRELDPLLDEADPIAESYIFEVGSAGCERQLKRPSDFQRFMGENVELHFYQPLEGRKTAVGKLSGYEGGSVTITDARGEHTYTKQQIAQVRLRMTI